MNTKNNQAYRVNEQKLQDAMLSLLETNTLLTITVKAICYEAGVNRSTFYAHYKDIPDLLHQLEHRIHATILNTYNSYEDASKSMVDGSFYTIFLTCIKEYKNFYKAWLQTRTNFPIHTGYEELLEYVVRPVCKKAGIIDEAEIRYYVVFYQAGLTYLIKTWVDNNCREPVEVLSDYLRNCIPTLSFAQSRK